MTCYWDQGGWHPWVRLHNNRFPSTSRIAAIARRSGPPTIIPGWGNANIDTTLNHLDLFVIGENGVVWSCSWHEGHPWNPWFQIHPETTFNQINPVVALNRMPERIDLFKVGRDNSVWTAWWSRMW